MKTLQASALNHLCLVTIVFMFCRAEPGYAGGLVAAWGNASTHGETTLPVGVSNIKAIAARGYHVLALKSDGSIIGWGDNSLGQNNIPPGLSSVTAIAAGRSHNLALKAAGTVAAWGDDGHGQADVPAGLSNVVAVAAGGYHSLALKADGTIVGWGDNLYGQADGAAGRSNVTAIAAGTYHSLALRADGTVVAWGYNYNGQTNVPVGLSNVVAVAAGAYHSLALKADGIIVGWGYDSYGVSTGGAGLSNVIAIATGSEHSLALKADGTVVAWGNGYYGADLPAGLPGAGAIAAGDRCSLALVPDGPVQIMQSPADQTAFYPYASNVVFSVTATGQALSYQWFLNGTAIKDNSRVSGSTAPNLVISSLQPSDIGTYTVAVMNSFGSVLSAGVPLTVIGAPALTQAPSPQAVRAGSDVALSAAVLGTPPLAYQWLFQGTNLAGATKVTLSLSEVQPSASGVYSLLVSNTYGSTQVNLSLTVTDAAPYIATQPSGASVPVGSSMTLAVSARGSLPLSYQWRFNGQSIAGATDATLALHNLNRNQTGYYDVAVSNAFGGIISAKALLNVIQGVYVWAPYSSQVPTNVPPGMTDAVAVAAGLHHVLALQRGGSVATWAAPGAYVPSALTNIPSNLNNVIAVAAAGNYSMALRGNGTVAVWGENSSGQSNVPVSATNLAAIAAGSTHCLALKSDGTIIGWGNNGYGQVNPPAGLSNVIAIAAGSATSFAVRNDGTVTAWGYTNSIAPPPSLTNVLAVSAPAAGGNHQALIADGSVTNWGYGTVQAPANNSNIVAISAGYCGAVLKSDGTVVPWGSYSTTFPSSISNVIAIAAGGDSYSPFLATIVGDGSPAITLQPANQTSTNGATVRLHVRAVGAQPLTYQWQLGGADIPNATNADLTITNIQSVNVGSYQAVVSSALDSVSSRSAQLAIVSLPYKGNLGTALNATNLVWTSNPANALWLAQMSVTHDGEAAAQSGRVADNGASFLVSTVTGPGMLAFWWKVSSEEGYDLLRFSANGPGPLLRASISGDVDWQQLTFNIPSGTYTLQWTYSKDSSVSVGQDAGWLDEVTFTPVPSITQQPQSQTAWMGSSVTFQADGSWGEMSCLQWLKNGTNLPQANSAFLTLTNLTRRDSGNHALQVTNVAGSVTSSNATLRVLVPQRLAAPHLPPDGSFAFSSGDADGGWLEPGDLAGLEIQASTNLVDWVTLPNTLGLTNGLLVIRDTGRTNYAVRFYRMVEH